MRLDRTTRPTAAPHRVGPAAQRIGIKELVGDTIAAKHPLTPSRGRDSAQVNEYVQRVHDWISQGQLVAAYELPWMLEADSIPVPTQHSARGTNALQPGDVYKRQLPLSLVVKNGSKILAITSAVMPVPVSALSLIHI